MDIVFVDIETTGLDPHQHELIEFALVTEKGEVSAFNDDISGGGLALREADTNALRINRYYERINDGDILSWRGKHIAETIAELTSGCVLAGANPHFDQHFLDVWMRRQGYAPAWDYHVLDVPTYAAASYNNRLARFCPKPRTKFLEPPFRMNNDLLDRLAVSRDESTKHTALGDAMLAYQIWQTIREQNGQQDN